MITRTVTFPEEVNEKLKVLAGTNKRSVHAEIQLALELHTRNVKLPGSPKRLRAVESADNSNKTR